MTPALITLFIHLLVTASLLPLAVTGGLIAAAVLIRNVLARFPAGLVFLCFVILAFRIYSIPTGPLPFFIVFFDCFLLWMVLSWENSPGDLKTFLTDLLKNGAQLSLVIGLLASLFFSVFPSSPFRSFLPSSSNATIGLGSSQEIQPGQQESLTPSGKTAFIVKTGIEIPRDRLYWRANSLTTTLDGMHWFHKKPVRNRVSDPDSEVKQKLVLFAHQSEVPVGLDSPSRVEVISENLMLAGTMKPEPDLPGPDAIESRSIRIADNRLMEKLAPWKPEKPGDELILRDRILDWYTREFSYSLSPGKLQHPRLSNFLLNSRQGYCEHFAASFSAIMRHLGVPSRVVSGYRGGTWNPISGSYRVDEDDAHAWSEFWSEKEKRWVRVDPTLSVPGAAPPNYSRTTGVPGQIYEAVISEIRLFFEENPGSALALSLTLFFVFLSGILAFTRKKQDPHEKLLELYRLYCRRGEKAGLPRLLHEGPEDYRIRLESHLPEQKILIGEFTGLYLQFRYGDRTPDRETLQTLRKILRRITFQAGIDPGSGSR